MKITYGQVLFAISFAAVAIAGIYAMIQVDTVWERFAIGCLVLIAMFRFRILRWLLR